MTLSSLYPIVHGLNSSLILTENIRIENSVRAGRNTVFTTGCQLTEMNTAMTYIDRTLHVFHAASLHYGLRSVVYIAPPLLAYVATCSIQDEHIRSTVIFVQDHIGLVCQIVVAVSSLALICFGNPLFGAVSLAILATGFLDQTGRLPTNIRQIFHQYSLPVMIGSSLFCGTLLDRIFVIANALSYAATLYSSWTKPTTIPTIENLPRNSLTIDQLKKCLTSDQNFFVNKAYIHVPTLPPAPDINIQNLLHRFQEINWTLHFHTLQTKLSSDKRFMERHGDPRQKTDLEVIDLAKTALQTLVNSIIERRILEGEPQDYERLHCYLKIITHYIEQEPNDITKTDVLLRLAVEGGEYCGPGKFEAIESIYASFIEGVVEIPFHTKLLNCLQTDRGTIVQAVYSLVIAEVQHNPLVPLLLDLHDLHVYNQFLNIYASTFGLRKGGADNDSLAIIDPIIKRIADYFVGDSMRDVFWEQHTADGIVTIVGESLGTTRLPKPEIYNWLQEWLQKQAIDSSVKARMMDELTTYNTLFDISLENTQGMIRPGLIQAMLFEMGIFAQHAIRS